MNQLLKAKNIFIRTASLLAFVLVFAFSVAPTISHAAGLVICGNESNEASLADNVNKSGGSQASLDAFNKSSCQFNQLIPEITHIINWLIASAGLYCVFWIVLIGFRMVLSSADGHAVAELKKQLISVITGLVIVMFAFIFVNIIYSILEIKINGASGFVFNPFTGQ